MKEKSIAKFLTKYGITIVIVMCGTFVNIRAVGSPIGYPMLKDEQHLPDALLLNQNGKEVKFYTDTIKDKIVVINFIFTNCKMICPLLGYNFGQLQALLSDQIGKKVFLISISVDPVADTPEKLKYWAGQFGNETGWTLLTGNKTQVNLVLKALESFTPDKVDHTSLVLMGHDRKGIWKRLSGTSSAALLASELAEWL